MEFYFNYAVVDKQKDYDTIAYDSRTISFSLDLNKNGKIDVAILKDKYTLFLSNVISSMNNKYLLYSDLYVQDINYNEIIFGLYIPPMSMHINRNQIIKNISDVINVSPIDQSFWDCEVVPITTNYNTLSVINDFFEGADEVVRRLSKKDVYDCLFSNITTAVPYVELLKETTNRIHLKPTPLGVSVLFVGDQLKNDLVVPTIVNLQNRISLKVPIDVNPRAWRELCLGDHSHNKYPQQDWYMSIFAYQYAKLIDISNNNSYLAHFVEHNLEFPIN